MSEILVFVTHRQWDAAINRIVRANLKAHGHSLSGASMRGGDIIYEIMDDKRGMLVKENWLAELKRLYLIPEAPDA